ncbi:MAG: hypothetical protein DMF89_13550 [Acidobacteria bacterium]|nr:MAG: hypothetical protein DMF89_13550 [Acidobacteriota bacterium]
MARAANFEKLTPMFALRRPVTTTLEVPSADGAAIQPGRYTKSAKARVRRHYHGRLLERCMRAIWAASIRMGLTSSNAIGTSSKMGAFA